MDRDGFAAAILSGLMASSYYRDNPEEAARLAWGHSKVMVDARPADAVVDAPKASRRKKE